MIVVIRWDEKAGLRRDAGRSQVIDALEAQEIKETGNREGQHHRGKADEQFSRTPTDDRSGPGRSLELAPNTSRRFNAQNTRRKPKAQQNSRALGLWGRPR